MLTTSLFIHHESWRLVISGFSTHSSESSNWNSLKYFSRDWKRINHLPSSLHDNYDTIEKNDSFINQISKGLKNVSLELRNLPVPWQLSQITLCDGKKGYFSWITKLHNCLLCWHFNSFPLRQRKVISHIPPKKKESHETPRRSREAAAMSILLLLSR